MNAVSKRILISSAALLLLLVGLNLWLWPNQSLQRSATSFGIMRDGYKAAFDLLTEMHFPVTRSYRRPKVVPTSQTIWFIAPSFLDVSRTSAHEAAAEVLDWVARGGTAVVFGEPDSDWEELGLSREIEDRTDKDTDRTLIEGDISPKPRWLDTPELVHFSGANEKATAAHSPERVVLAADGKPFALEVTPKGGKSGGRLIAIAGARFLRNEYLADADASVLLVDLARKYGAPAFDEHSHGLAPPSSLTFAILDSRAILPLIIGLMAAILWALSQRLWPPRLLDENADLPAPSIASFVESLSILYSRSGDPAAVFRAYRAGFLRRLRRQMGVRADHPEDLMLERIARDGSLPGETREWLLGHAMPADQRDLVIAVRAIESYPKLGNLRHENRA